MGSKEALKSVAQGNLLFSKEVYQALSKNTKGNVFISPLSVEVVLALAHAGARGTTAQQIAAVLHLPEDESVVQAGFHALMSSFKSSKNMTLEIANKIFSQEGYNLRKEYQNIAEKAFLSGAEEVNFAESSKATKTINSWVEEKTKNKIKDLIPEGMLDAMTRLVLVNAIYFKGLWKNQFNKEATQPGDFFLNSKEKKQVPMMYQKAKFGFASLDELQATALEMPYQGDNLSLVIFLPNEIDGIANLESKLKDVNLGEVLKKFHTTDVEVIIPKFKLEETTDFNDILKEMGAKDMFDQLTADFSGMSGSKDLYVSKVLQKAFIEVNEEGSEAAAATGIMMLRSMPMRPRKFVANHPFIFVLWNHESRVILFIGKLTEV